MMSMETKTPSKFVKLLYQDRLLLSRDESSILKDKGPAQT